jgi:hypothetical protein
MLHIVLVHPERSDQPVQFVRLFLGKSGGLAKRYTGGSCGQNPGFIGREGDVEHWGTAYGHDLSPGGGQPQHLGLILALRQAAGEQGNAAIFAPQNLPYREVLWERQIGQGRQSLGLIEVKVFQRVVKQGSPTEIEQNVAPRGVDPECVPSRSVREGQFAEYAPGLQLAFVKAAGEELLRQDAVKNISLNVVKFAC